MRDKLNKIKTATKADLKVLEKKLEKSFKNELENKLKDTELALMIRIEDRAQNTEENLKEAIRQSTNDLMTKIDSFAGRTKALEDENTIGAHNTRELEVRVDDREGRITKLESPQAA